MNLGPGTGSAYREKCVNIKNGLTYKYEVDKNRI